ncbi:hypothetical protein vBRpoPV14_04 [Ruegeria phage vB_RpoP-V14]|nr:hypothetical protein HYP62_gp03 [Ruegeria phage vB_RpoP-V12]AWY08790.1 hypothetical protein vBRpoPV12_3 [Ruegeria phage vB_RpoP-V12]AWY08961.1 hypothetical protein vBRpoPV21_3 [Ruegeria phage vB_RpoP-V21]AWY09522.1 hypothetical protein vBRpoPV17_3 [Ruegeria phage vB_RpoP-V17]AXF42122.1 hypothetical protein vBRpoPV14_04 [Ruegeria phage vB_RpoP-V14]
MIIHSSDIQNAMPVKLFGDINLLVSPDIFLTLQFFREERTMTRNFYKKGRVIVDPYAQNGIKLEVDENINVNGIELSVLCSPEESAAIEAKVPGFSDCNNPLNQIIFYR